MLFNSILISFAIIHQRTRKCFLKPHQCLPDNGIYFFFVDLEFYRFREIKHQKDSSVFGNLSCLDLALIAVEMILPETVRHIHLIIRDFVLLFK